MLDLCEACMGGGLLLLVLFNDVLVGGGLFAVGALIHYSHGGF